MLKYFISFTLFIFCHFCFAQKNEWKPYYNDEYVDIYFTYADCHNPKEGTHHENVLLRIVNRTNADVEVAYNLKRFYNGKETISDIPNYSFKLAGSETKESSCENLIQGLFVFSKMLNTKPASILTSFELHNLSINGKTTNQ